MTGFDSLVDELMACHGYDRDEAELIAQAKLAAGANRPRVIPNVEGAESISPTLPSHIGPNDEIYPPLGEAR